MTTDVIARFASLFAGRTDALGLEDGGCARITVDERTYKNHLTGFIAPIGIYNLCDGNVVKWGAIDIDYEDIQEAVNVHDLLAQVGVPSFIERSRSKGYHVWVFVEDWISAKTMRRALLVVRDFLKMEAREVYPKQEELDPTKPFGNYLRLPYPGALAENSNGGYSCDGRRVMLGEDYPWDLTMFLNNVKYADPADLEKLAARYFPPVIHLGEGVTKMRKMMEYGSFPDVMGYARKILKRLDNPLIWHIFNKGSIDGQDRSGALMRLCDKVATAGAEASEALVILMAADQQDWCQKFCVRSDGEQRLMSMVERVYGPEPGTP